MKKNLPENLGMSKIVLIVIAVSALISISVSCFILNTVIKSHDEETIKLISADVYDSINNELLKAIMVSQTMANDSFLRHTLENEKNLSQEQRGELFKNYLHEIKNNFFYSSAYIISDGSKNYYTENGIHKQVDTEKNPHDIWYKNFLKKNVEYAFDVDHDETNDDIWTIFINSRIRDTDGGLLGVCGIGLKLDVIQTILRINENNYDIKIDLLDRKNAYDIDTNAAKFKDPHLRNIVDNLHKNIRNADKLNLSRVDDVYIVTKYIPEIDWYLVIRRDVNMQTIFSNWIFYISVGFLIALIILLIFIRYRLNKGSKEIEETAKKHGIASHAGLYISMHLIDFGSDTIHELSRDPKVNLFIIDDGESAAAKIKHAVEEITAPESLSEMMLFVDFETLAERMKGHYELHQEFVSEKCGWCKAYFMLVDDNEDGSINQIVFAVELIDEAKRREKQLVYLSETDAMTGLRNRGSGEKTITALMNEGIEGMFCLLDADKFKSINDNYGHEVGDKVIKAIAQCLKKSFRNSDIVMRLGGDEFAAYALGVTNAEQAKIIVDRFFGEIDKIDIPELGDRKITVSLGTALFSIQDYCSFTEIYKRADSATYISKKTQGNCHTAYEDEKLS